MTGRKSSPLTPLHFPGGNPVLTNLKSVLVDEDGATLVEYALVVSLIAIACIATVTALGAQINTAFTTMQSKLAAA